MKGQVNLILVFMLVAVLGTLTFVLFKASTAQETVETIEYYSFVNSLENQISVVQTRPIGSREQFTLAMPPDISEVCFSSQDDAYDLYSNPKVHAGRELVADATVFFEPSDVFVPLAVDGFSTVQNPLCVRVENNRLQIELESRGDSVVIDAISEENVVPAACSSFSYSGDDKLDLVFLNYGYSDVAEFYNEVQRYYDEIFQGIEPYASFPDAYNVYVVDEEVDFCEISYVPVQYIRCDNVALHTTASACPHDHVFLLANVGSVANLAGIRSSSIGNLLKINTADDSVLVVAHEFGHSFGKLTDEYVDTSTYSSRVDVVENSANCDLSPCDKWNSVSGTGCYAGCSLSSFNRPTENSIMRYYMDSGGDIYGPVNEEIIRNKLGVYS